jgi:hypothetical protein
MWLGLTIIERSVLPERPAFFVTAGRRGGGKTTALIMLLVAATGIRPSAATWSPNEEDRRKSLLSYLIEALSAIIWDNIPRGAQIACSHIEKSCTTAFFSDRRLGASEKVAVSASVVHLFTDRLRRALLLQAAHLNLPGGGVCRRDYQCSNGKEAGDEVVAARSPSRRGRPRLGYIGPAGPEPGTAMTFLSRGGHPRELVPAMPKKPPHGLAALRPFRATPSAIWWPSRSVWAPPADGTACWTCRPSVPKEPSGQIGLVTCCITGSCPPQRSGRGRRAGSYKCVTRGRDALPGSREQSRPPR